MWQENSPFKNKSAEELHEMFISKGFELKCKGPKTNCMEGRGSYLHPISERQYYIDPKNKGIYREPNHVDVGRHPEYQGPLKKKRFAYLDED